MRQVGLCEAEAEAGESDSPLSVGEELEDGLPARLPKQANNNQS